MSRNSLPESDENEVLEVAALLDITEFRVFSIAYWRWFGRRSSAQAMERYFANYMFHSIVPPWVHHFTREILMHAHAGTLVAADYGIHRARPTRVMRRRGQLFAAVLLAFCFLMLLAALYYDDLVQLAETCYFPPCY
jgi:hypothetical protein